METLFLMNHQQDLCICAALRGAARSTTQLYDLVLRPSGLKATQFIALRAIEEAGEMPQWRFAREHAVAPETLSRRLAVLRKKGLLSVRTGANHGERIYSLTLEGRQALLSATPYWQRAQERLRLTLGEPEVQALLSLCESAVTAAQKAEQLRARNASGSLVIDRNLPETGPIISRSIVARSAVPRSSATPAPAK